MVEPPLIEPPLKQRRVVSYPDEELFVSPLLYEDDSYCRNDVRWNSELCYNKQY